MTVYDRCVVALCLLGAAGCSHPPIWHIESPLSPVAPPPSPDQRTLQAGLGKVDITPPPGVGLAGNGPEGARAAGYRKRLYARVVVLQDARGERLALVTADLPHVSALLQREVARRTVSDSIGADRLVLSATHTHSGPGHFYEAKQYNASNSSVSGYDPVLVDTIASRIARTISAAVRHRRPAKLAWGSTPVWGQTRIRSLPAMLRNEPRPTAPPDAPAGLPLAYTLVDPTLTMLRVDLYDSAAGRYVPAGAWSVFAMHGTGNAPANDLFDPDVHGIVSEVVERHIDGKEGGDTTGFMHHAVYAFANGTEGDVSPDWPPQSRCALPQLRREARATGPFAARRWNWREPGARHLGVCIDAGRRGVERVGKAVGAAAAALFDRLAGSLSDTLTIARTFTTLDLAGAWKRLGICEHAQAGLSALGGAPDSYSRMYGWRWLGVFYSGMEQSPRSPRVSPSGCQAQKRLLLWERATYALIGSQLPRGAQLGAYRIGGVVLAGVPAEVTTTAGAQMVRAMRAVDSMHRAVVVSLTNGFMQYVTTSDEYGAQYYEGGSTLYGPGEAAMFATQLAGLAKLLGGNALPPQASLTIRADTSGGRRPDAVAESALGRVWCEGDTLHARVGLARRGGWIVRDSQEIGRPLVEILREAKVAAMDDDANLEVRLRPRDGTPPWEVRWRVSAPGAYAVRVASGPTSDTVSCPVRGARRPR